MSSPSQNSPVLLKAQNVCKSYVDGSRTLTVLQGVNLEVHSGEFLSIIGQSGSGKSTLLHLLGALDQATEGSINLGEMVYGKMTARERAKLRTERVGFMYQFHHLLPEFTALENVSMPGMIAGKPIAQVIARATELLERVGLGQRLSHRPTKLSGGEQQRVALARALMNDPDLLLADEPTGDLDQKTGREIMDFVIQETRRQGKSLIVVTHDPALAALADRTVLLENGQLRERDN
ncbi:MAG: ABC transporter ATP-binding protein [Candidatus Sumerlaeia bacterium]|nr:ABC transporter ATP-binding protein [Candidatus Sumerlaeia bacterium]